MTVSTINPKWAPVFAIAGLLILWQVMADKLNMPLLVPTPLAVGKELAHLVATGDFWRHLCASILRGLLGFGMAFGMGLGLGWFAGRNVFLEALLQPLLAALRSTPSMSFIILALIWFKGDWVPVVVTFLVVLPIIVQNIQEGIRGVDPDLTEMVMVFQLTPWRRFVRLELPTLMPFLAAAIATGLGFTWKVLIAAEVLAYPHWGIGTQLDTARVYLHTDQVFAWTLVVAVIGLSFDYALDYSLRKPFSAWKGMER